MGVGGRRGAILIVVLAVLLILALLGTMFVTLCSLDRSVSRNYADAVRARLLAQSGIEDGLQRLTGSLALGMSAFQSKAWRYYGNDLAETGNGALMAVPLETAQNPSFAWELDGNPGDSNPAPRTIQVGGKTVGFSGVHESGSYGLHGDFYTLRIRDAQGSLHVNDGLREAGWVDTNGDGAVNANDSSVSQNLRRILNNLGANPSVGVPGLGNLILAKRPVGGYQALQDLQPVLGTASFDKVKEYLTVRAWTDRNVADPVPLSGQALSDYPVQYYRGSGVYRYGRNKNASGQPVATPLSFAPPGTYWANNWVAGMDELNPQHIQIVERAPVNVNTAPREVLVALLDGLKGFFVIEARGNSLPQWTDAYAWLGWTNTTGGTPVSIHQTVPIVGPGTPGVSGISASAVAEHLIACREKKATPAGVTPSFDYSSAWWGGSFVSWTQFDRFCDNLVTIGLLADNRPLFVDVVNPTTMGAGSDTQRKGAQAIADVLKANFNPNLHLNEANPDANLFTSVDKTDLIVNSTEFCFLPQGYFTIESLGRIVRPKDTEDAWTAGDNEIVAQAKIGAVVKLYDAYRETHQKHFYAGTLSARQGLPASNNNLSLETGPEPDQGNGPSENEWDGYLALPTIGGVGTTKAKNAVVATPNGTSEAGDVLHAHFAGDTLLHYHIDGIRDELGAATVAGEGVANLPDRTETLAGPYSPTMGGGNVYRLARSFRLQPGQSFPPLDYRAPLDLRIDGAYSEHHSAPAYWLSQNVLGASIGSADGVLSMWVKPSFFPEMSGAPRTWVNMDRYHIQGSSYVNPSPFGLIYTASNDAASYKPSPAENGNPFYNLGYPFGVMGLRPMCLAFGYGYSSYTGYGNSPYVIAEGGCVTPSLNHLSHPDAATKSSPMKGHEWVHVVLTWRPANPNDCSIYVNGQYLPGSSRVWYTYYSSNSQKDWSQHDGNDRNTLRLGAVSRYRTTTGWGYARNWTADATLDEVYVWKGVSSSLQTALSQWQQGRYRAPASADEGVFTSAPIDLTGEARFLPPSSTAVPPASTGAATSATAIPAVPPGVRILGVSWTWFGGCVDSTGSPILVDRATGIALHPKVDVSIVAGNQEYGPYSDAGYSPVSGPGGQPLNVSGTVQYRVRFTIPDAQFDSVLCSTPVFDDVTIFYRTAEPQFESYALD